MLLMAKLHIPLSYARSLADRRIAYVFCRPAGILCGADECHDAAEPESVEHPALSGVRAALAGGDLAACSCILFGI